MRISMRVKTLEVYFNNFFLLTFSMKKTKQKNTAKLTPFNIFSEFIELFGGGGGGGGGTSQDSSTTV